MNRDLVSEIQAGLEHLRPRPLESLGEDSLMDRLDRKFLIPTCQVPLLLEECRWAYKVLEVEGQRLHPYFTTYLDTPDLHFYFQHHGGRARRQKVRIREYGATSHRFLEVKARTPNGRTLKTRRPLDPCHGVGLVEHANDGRLKRPGPGNGRFSPCAPGMRPPVLPLLLDHRRTSWEPFGLRPLEVFSNPTLPLRLQEMVDVGYRRLTLLGRAGVEKVTVDLDLSFHPMGNGGGGSGVEGSASGKPDGVFFPGTAVMEVKQERRGPSPVLELMRSLGHRSLSFSKYCMAVARLHPDVKQNVFKSGLRRLGKVEAEA
ncbi:MAG: polyphosphate polymerase domain-containing protein [Gemmatimonadota bacterium]